jgi:hypothetical protein
MTGHRHAPHPHPLPTGGREADCRIRSAQTCTAGASLPPLWGRDGVGGTRPAKATTLGVMP